MKTVFHIGWHKTGTSYLQKFFASNASLLLREHAILYPRAGRRGSAHHLLFNKVVDAGGGISTTADDREWAALIEELTRHSDDSTRFALLSTEKLHGLNKSGVGALTDFPVFADGSAIAVAYIRRHDLYLESKFSEWIKMGRQITWGQFHSKMRSGSSLFLKALNRYRDNPLFGQITVRPFSKHRWVDEDLAADFLWHAFRVKLADDFVNPFKVNRSPDPRVLHIMSRFHREWQKTGEAPLPPAVLKAAIIAPLDEALVRVGLNRQQPVFLAPEERLSLLDRFAGEIAELAEITSGEVNFAEDSVRLNEENRALLEAPAPGEIGSILESYLEPDHFDSAWDRVAVRNRPRAATTRDVFRSLEDSGPDP